MSCRYIVTVITKVFEFVFVSLLTSFLSITGDFVLFGAVLVEVHGSTKR